MRNFFKLKNKKGQRGAAMVEFAIIVPVLLLLLFGIIEFSLLLYNQQIITNAAREGARAAINPSPRIEDEEVIRTIVAEYVSSARLITFRNNPLVTNVNGLGGEAGDDVTVSVEYEYEFLLPGFLNLGPTYTLQSITIMRLL